MGKMRGMDAQAMKSSDGMLSPRQLKELQKIGGRSIGT